MEQRETKTRDDKQNINKLADLNTTISIIITNVNRLNIPLKKPRQNGLKRKRKSSADYQRVL